MNLVENLMLMQLMKIRKTANEKKEKNIDSDLLWLQHIIWLLNIIQMANGWSCNGTRFCIRWKIDVLFNEANASFAYFIHKTISVRDKIAQIRTNTQSKVTCIVTSCPPAEWYETARLCNGTRFCTLSSHRLVHKKLSRCCTILKQAHCASGL